MSQEVSPPQRNRVSIFRESRAERRFTSGKATAMMGTVRHVLAKSSQGGGCVAKQCDNW
jgi:hypothetical protein